MVAEGKGWKSELVDPNACYRKAETFGRLLPENNVTYRVIY